MPSRRREEGLGRGVQRAAGTEVHEEESVAGPARSDGVEEADDKGIWREDRRIRAAPGAGRVPDRGRVAAEPQQVAVEGEHRTPTVGLALAVVEAGPGECLGFGRIGNPCLGLGRRIARELRKEFASARVDVGRKLAVVIGEEPER